MLREGKCLAQSHTAGGWQHQYMNSSLSESRARLFLAASCCLLSLSLPGQLYSVTHAFHLAYDTGISYATYLQPLFCYPILHVLMCPIHA